VSGRGGERVVMMGVDDPRRQLAPRCSRVVLHGSRAIARLGVVPQMASQRLRMHGTRKEGGGDTGCIITCVARTNRNWSSLLDWSAQLAQLPAISAAQGPL